MNSTPVHWQQYKGAEMQGKLKRTDEPIFNNQLADVYF